MKATKPYTAFVGLDYEHAHSSCIKNGVLNLTAQKKRDDEDRRTVVAFNGLPVKERKAAIEARKAFWEEHVKV